MTEATGSEQGNPPESPAAPAAAAPAAAPAAPAANAPWYGSADPETLGWMENKGFKQDSLTPELALKVIHNNRSLEKLMGAPADRLLKLPAADAAPEEWNGVFAKLGKPAEAAGYEIPLPEKGADPAFAEWAKSAFFESDMTKAQAARLTEKWNGYVAKATEAAENAFLEKANAEVQALKGEWGAAFEKHTAIAKQAAKAFGVDEATMDKLERGMGSAAMLKFFHNIGAKIGEDSFEGAGSTPSFNGVYTPEGAKSKIAELQRDSAWTSRYLAGGKVELDEMRRLQEMANVRR